MLTTQLVKVKRQELMRSLKLSLKLFETLSISLMKLRCCQPPKKSSDQLKVTLKLWNQNNPKAQQMRKRRSN